MSQVPDTLAVAEARPWSESLRLYIDVARPKVIALVVFTGMPMLVLGRDAWPDVWTAFWVLTGTAFAGAASSAFNAWVERESDARMARTRRRPLPAASVLPQAVVGYGALMTVLSTAILWLVGGWLAAAVSLATIAFYVLVYTLWLKPRTPQNIVIGGAAGSTAPLIVSAALDGELTVAAWVLFAIVFLWTPPHFWAIALFRKEEYASAGFPMMPLVVGDQPTRWRSLAYAVATLAVSLVPVALGDLTWAYGAVATAVGLWFIVAIVQSMRQQHPAADRQVFKVSLYHLSLLYLAMFVDGAVL